MTMCKYTLAWTETLVDKHKKLNWYFQYLLIRLIQQPLYSTVFIGYQDTTCVRSQNQYMFLHRVKLKTDLQAFCSTEFSCIFRSVYTINSPRICICSLKFFRVLGRQRNNKKIGKSPRKHATHGQKWDTSPSTSYFIGNKFC